jgi:hypothetical protein
MPICALNWLSEYMSQALVAHPCNPSYTRDRDQEGGGLKPAGANSSWYPTENTQHKKGRWSDSSGRVPA